MNWINDTQKAINYIESNLLENISVENISEHVYASKDYFQKVFSIVTGLSISEYIRNRRLSLAGQELAFSNNKIIDIALKYGYETPESFSKAFSRFHGFTPLEARSNKNSLKCFCPLTIQIDVKGGFVMSRKLIPNVEQLYEKPSDNYMFCSCMRSAMAVLNEDNAFDFTFFTGITGDLFTQTWYTQKWLYNNEYSSLFDYTIEPYHAAFHACGYEYEYIKKEEINKNEPEYVKKIVESIDKGFPVFTFGIVGPPTCSIIYGYDENGDVLIGWSQFTDKPKEENPLDLVCSENYFQVRNGLDRSNALIFFGKKTDTPSIKESLKNSLLNIHKFASLPQIEKIHFGKKAFDDWANSLLCDEYFKNEDMLVHAMDTYGSCIVMVGTNMYFIQQYLDKALELCPEISEQIQKLKEAYEKENEALQEVVELQGGYFFDADRKALLKKELRIKLAEHVRKIGQYYEKAAFIFN